LEVAAAAAAAASGGTSDGNCHPVETSAAAGHNKLWRVRSVGHTELAPKPPRLASNGDVVSADFNRQTSETDNRLLQIGKSAGWQCRRGDFRGQVMASNQR